MTIRFTPLLGLSVILLLFAGCAAHTVNQSVSHSRETTQLPRMVGEPFSSRITDPVAALDILRVAEGALPLAEQLEVRLLGELAVLDDPRGIDSAFDRVWDTEAVLRKLISGEGATDSFIPALALCYFMLTHNNAYTWRDETARKLYWRWLADAGPEDLQGYSLHFFTYALLRNRHFEHALPFLRELAQINTPEVYRRNLEIAASHGRNANDADFMEKIVLLRGDEPMVARDSLKGIGEPDQWQVLSTSPGVKVISEIQRSPGRILPSGQHPRDAAYRWLVQNGLEEGRNLRDGRLLYVSVGAAPVGAMPSESGYIDSRYLAFQRALLSARAKTAIFLGVDLSTERGIMEWEIDAADRYALQNIRAAINRLQIYPDPVGEVRQPVDKPMDRQAGPQGQANPWPDPLFRLGGISGVSAKAAAAAFGEVQGIQVIQAFEGSYHGHSQAVVVTLWSQNLERLVNIMQDPDASGRIPPSRLGDTIADQLPENDHELACLVGVRAYINQQGEHVLLAFGHSAVDVAGGRADFAHARAEQRARLRAMAALRNFMGERVAFSATDEVAELLALYSGHYEGEDSPQEYRIIQRFSQMIQAEAASMPLAGVYGVYTKDLTHPFTAHPMVLSVMAWSPRSGAEADEARRMIAPDNADDGGLSRHRRGISNPGPMEEGVISSGQGANPDTW